MTITRREALKVLALSASACTRKPPQSETKSVQVPLEPKKETKVIETVTPLPSSGPWPTDDPFLFCVHHNDQYPKGNKNLGPEASLGGRQLGMDFSSKDGWSMYHGETVPGFPRHPHRGFETVTVVRDGLVDHADSMGAAARYGKGDVQWLTAGAGINHAEMFPLLDSDKPNPIDFFQIWLNLPGAKKMVPPYFSMFWANEVPIVKSEDSQGNFSELRIVAGRYGDTKLQKPPPDSWAANETSDVAIWSIKMKANAMLSLPQVNAGTLRSLYFFSGDKLKVGPQLVSLGNKIKLATEGAVALVNGAEDSDILLLQGRPIGEPVVQHGPFVMNSREEIHQAIYDYRKTEFGGWPWKEADPVHGTKAQRFAQFIDGKREEPG